MLVQFIKNSFAALHAELSRLAFPLENPDLKNLAETLDKGLQKITLDLSAPPTLSQLQTAELRLDPLRPKIDVLYRALLAERKKSS